MNLQILSSFYVWKMHTHTHSKIHKVRGEECEERSKVDAPHEALGSVIIQEGQRVYPPVKVDSFRNSSGYFPMYDRQKVLQVHVQNNLCDRLITTTVISSKNTTITIEKWLITADIALFFNNQRPCLCLPKNKMFIPVILAAFSSWLTRFSSSSSFSSSKSSRLPMSACFMLIRLAKLCISSSLKNRISCW